MSEFFQLKGYKFHWKKIWQTDCQIEVQRKQVQMQHALVLKGGQPHLSLFLNLGSERNCCQSNWIESCKVKVTFNDSKLKKHQKIPFCYYFFNLKHHLALILDLNHMQVCKQSIPTSPVTKYLVEAECKISVGSSVTLIR